MNIERLYEAARKGFLTCNSGPRLPNVHIDFSILEDAQAFHAALLSLLSDETKRRELDEGGIVGGFTIEEARRIESLPDPPPLEVPELREQGEASALFQRLGDLEKEALLIDRRDDKKQIAALEAENVRLRERLGVKIDQLRSDTLVEQYLADPATRKQFLQAQAELHGEDIADLKAEIAQLTAECDDARRRLLTAAGDDLCRLTQDEIKAMTSGAVKIPPEEEFLASCKRFHAQMAAEAGVNHGCLTLAQLIAENERLTAERDAAKTDVWNAQHECQQLRAMNAGNWWRWQGDGSDHLESLSAPVSIDAADLQAIIAERDALAERIAQLMEIVDCTADGVPVAECDHLYCPHCGSEVEQQTIFNGLCYECVNPDDGCNPSQPPLPLLYSSCKSKPE